MKNLFRDEVNKALIDAGLTQEQFSKMAGVKRGYFISQLSGLKKVCPSMYQRIVKQGLATIPVQIEYALDRRAMDVTGLSREQVTELVKMADGMRKGAQ